MPEQSSPIQDYRSAAAKHRWLICPSEDLQDSNQLVSTLLGLRPKRWILDTIGHWISSAEYGTNVALSAEPLGLPVLRMNNIQHGEFDLSELKFAPAEHVAHLRLRKNDVLFNRTNSWEHVGKAAIWRDTETGPAFASYLVRLHCSPGLLPEFLSLWINWEPVQRLIRQFATPGVSQVNINPTSLRRTPAAIPSSEMEQELIVRRISALEGAIAAIEKATQKLTLAKLGLVDELISIPAQVGQSEAPHTLGNLVASISSGCSVNADDRPPTAGEFGVLKTSAIGGGRFHPQESKAVWAREVSRLKCPVVAGLILFSRMNTPQLVGESAFVDQDYPGLFLPDRLWAITVREEEGILPEWVATILRTRQARAFITGEATGTSGSMKNIARASLIRLPMRKLPESDQADAMKSLRALQFEIDTLTTERDKLAALRFGLRDDLLTGRKPVGAIREAAE